jgi:hypothetical protein
MILIITKWSHLSKPAVRNLFDSRKVPAVLTVFLLITTVFTFRTATDKSISATWVSISEEAFPYEWPLKIPSGELSCAGDDFQVWFKAPNKEIFAVSGPAHQRRFFIRSIDEISRIERTQLISPTIDLLRFGMTLCSTSYMGEQN